MSHRVFALCLANSSKKGILVFKVHIRQINNMNNCQAINYRTRAIISRGLYIFYPIFQWCL